MDLVRKILRQVEESTDMRTFEVDPLDNPEDVVDYHQYLIIDAGLAIGGDRTNVQSRHPAARVTSLTWQGHEFLEASRDPTIWSKAKSTAAKVGGVTFPIMMSILADLAIQQLGISKI